MAGNAYASEKNAFGICDRCGFRYKLVKLRKERSNLNMQNLRVCPECWDKDHPQDKLGRIDHSDSQALRDPRPQNDLFRSRYGNSIVEKFKTSLNNWAYDDSSGGSNGSVAHDAENQYMRMAWSGESAPAFFDNTYLFDSSVYKRVRLRFRPTHQDFTFSGNLVWLNSPETGGSVLDRTKTFSGNPFVRSMGDPFVEVVWDLSNADEWTGTIVALRFDLYNAGPTSGSIDVDRISVEELV